MPLTPEQLDIVVKTVLGEARPNDPEGQAAVAWVIRNRANSGQFPSDPAKVAKQKYQFSAWNDKSNGGNDQVNTPSSSPAYQAVAQIVQQVFDDQVPDPTGGATYYHTPAVNPSWDNNMTKTAELGGHIFFSPDKNAKPAAVTASNIGTIDNRMLSMLGYGDNIGRVVADTPAPYQMLPAPKPLTSPQKGTPPGTRLNLTTGGTVAAPSGQIYKVGDTIPSADGQRTLRVVDKGNGVAGFEQVRNPFDIPGVINVNREMNAPTLAGGYIRNAMQNIPKPDMAPVQQAAASAGSAASGALEKGKEALTAGATGLLGGIGSLFKGQTNAPVPPKPIPDAPYNVTRQNMGITPPPMSTASIPKPMTPPLAPGLTAAQKYAISAVPPAPVSVPPPSVPNLPTQAQLQAMRAVGPSAYLMPTNYMPPMVSPSLVPTMTLPQTVSPITAPQGPQQRRPVNATPTYNAPPPVMPVKLASGTMALPGTRTPHGGVVQKTGSIVFGASAAPGYRNRTTPAPGAPKPFWQQVQENGY